MYNTYGYFHKRTKMKGRSTKYKEPTMEELREEAAKHATKTEFNRASPKLYRYAWSNGLLPEICGHMFDARKTWTLDKLKAEASKFTTRTEFQTQSSKAYQAARYQGVLDEICAHMSSRKGSDIDTIYIGWFPGTDRYKIGVTSARLGFNRPQYLAKTLGLELILLAKVTESGHALEQALLRIGRVPDNPEHSEVREWTEADKQKALKLVFENC